MNNPNNPNIGKISDNLPDDDIAELFDRQGLEVPTALDDQIRAMARAELDSNANATSTTQGYSRTRQYGPWFATAAVMVLAVALVPMLIPQQPTQTSPRSTQAASSEPSPELMVAAPGVSQDGSDAVLSAQQVSQSDAAETVAQLQLDKTPQAPQQKQSAEPVVSTASRVVASESKAEEATTETLARTSSSGSGGAAGSKAEDTINTDDAIVDHSVDAADPIVETEGVTPNIVTAETNLLTLESDETSGDVGAELAKTKVVPSYRINQKAWLFEVKRLYTQKQYRVFVDELMLFRKKHPQVDLKEHLSEDALKKEAELSK